MERREAALKAVLKEMKRSVSVQQAEKEDITVFFSVLFWVFLLWMNE